jgi:hypothetical protein
MRRQGKKFALSQRQLNSQSTKRALAVEMRRQKMPVLASSMPRLMKNVGLTQKQVGDMIDKAVSDEKKRLDIGQAGADYLECVVNPRGTGRAVAMAAKIPDGSNESTYLVHETGNYTWANGTNTSAWITCCGACVTGTTWDQTLQISYGAGTGAGETMTAINEQFCTQSSALGSVIMATTKYRVVNAYLRIGNIPTDTIKATYKGHLVPMMPRYLVANYHANSVILNGACNTQKITRNAQQGITVRRNCPGDFKNFHIANANGYTGVGSSTYENANGPMPWIECTSLSNSTYDIEWGVLYEVCGASESAISVASPPPNEPELEEIQYEINKVDFVTEANSFRSFLADVWGGVQKVGNFVYKNREGLAKILSVVRSIK